MKITEWIELLRSGKYTQGKNFLKFKTQEGQICHCCLGVLAENTSFQESSPNVLEYDCDYDEPRTYYFGWDENYDNSCLTHDIMFDDVKWICNDHGGFDLDDIDPLYHNRVLEIFLKYDKPFNGNLVKPFSLAAFNDAGATFEEIAEILSYMR